MSLPVDLDELPLKQIQDEQSRRDNLWANNACPYCTGPMYGQEHHCKMLGQMHQYYPAAAEAADQQLEKFKKI